VGSNLSQTKADFNPVSSGTVIGQALYQKTTKAGIRFFLMLEKRAVSLSHPAPLPLLQMIMAAHLTHTGHCFVT